MRNNLWPVLRRLAVLAVLGCCLALLNSSRATPTALASDFCADCDTFAAACTQNCGDSYNACVSQHGGNGTACNDSLDSCNGTCVGDYEFCLDGCDLASPSGANPNCGKGRTVCEQACVAAKGDCIQNGGDTCGEDYQACMDGCCV